MKLKSYHFYLFTLRNGKKKIAYGADPDHALEILARRLTVAEMDQIDRDIPPEEIRQQELQRHVHELG